MKPNGYSSEESIHQYSYIHSYIQILTSIGLLKAPLEKHNLAAIEANFNRTISSAY
jgi:hypothetical protein